MSIGHPVALLLYPSQIRVIHHAVFIDSNQAALQRAAQVRLQGTDTVGIEL
jgi:hypothetical protein